MSDQVENILWCSDCMLKHSRDLLHHAEAKGDSELKKHAEKAFEIASKMAGVKDRKSYSEIRDLEHHAEDLITGLRTERKKLQKSDCPTCGKLKDLVGRLKPKDLNTSGSQRLNISSKDGGNMVKESITNSLVGGFVGKGISTVTPMVITGATAGISNSTLANLGIGVVLEALAMYGKLPSKAELPLTMAGGFLIANEVVDLIMGYIPTPAVAVAAPRAVSNAGVSVGVGAPAAMYRTAFGAPGASAQYANGSLIFVD